MKYHLNRRNFLAAAAGAAGTAVLTPRRAKASRAKAAEFKTKMYKALKGLPSEETFKAWKAAGFEGMDTSGEAGWNISPADALKTRKLAEKYGIKIHGVVRAWTNVNSSNKGAVAKDIASIETALRAAEGYGADTILLVPCRIGGMPMPKAWEFDIKFDEKTGHLKQVVAGDNTKYEKYIQAHDLSTDAVRKALASLIPVAEKTGVVIAVENVWNNLWVKPDIFKNLIVSFGSPWVQAYFDIGNHVKYALPEEWIRTLGNLIVKCDVKDFKLNPNGRGGSFADIRDGSVDWPLVRKELDKIGRDELWMTIEGSGGLSLEDRNRRLDLIIAGK
jgi:hexulose-6-phosphate isomerase